MNLEDLVRVGEVVSTNPENCTVRVRLADRDDFITGDMMVIQPKTKSDKFYFMPDIDEMVVCLFLGNGAIAGFVLGSAYNKKDTPVSEIAGQNKAYIQFEDGTRIVYEKDEELLTAIVEGSVEATVRDKVTLTTPELEINADETTINGDSVEINADDEVNINTPKTIMSNKVELGGNTYAVVHEATMCAMWGCCNNINASTKATTQ